MVEPFPDIKCAGLLTDRLAFLSPSCTVFVLPDFVWYLLLLSIVKIEKLLPH
jgi:hypothetical protein